MTDSTTVSELVVTGHRPQAVGRQTASFRGVPFGVMSDEGQLGRRLAIHEYPNRDKPWPEDMGRKTRRFMLSGFLVTNSLAYGGGDVLGQLSRMIVAAETPGLGKLVHPVLGTLSVALEGFHYARRQDSSRYIDIDFAFVEGGTAVFPTNAAARGQGVLSALAVLQAAASGDFAAAILPLLPLGGLTQLAVTTAVAGWTAQIARVVEDATLTINLAARLTGNFGRYFNGANGLAPLQTLAPDTTIADLIADQTVARAAVTAAAASETTLGATLGLPAATPADFATGVQALVTAAAAAAANPADAVRLLLSLSAYASTGTDSATAAVDLTHQRMIVAALASAAESYQPVSYNDAAALRASVTAALDVQITAAGDNGDDASFAALRALRATVVADLTARGAALASVTTVVLPVSLPGLALAQRLYRDPTRADALVAEVNPPNPLFFPPIFDALAA